MKILVFYPYVPYPLHSGTNHRTFHLLRELARLHEVDLLALSENGEGMEHKEVFEEFCERVEFLPYQHPRWQKLLPQRLFNPMPTTVTHWTVPGVMEKLDVLLSTKDYDAAHVCDIVLAQYFMSPTNGSLFSKRRLSIPLVIDRSRVDLLYQLSEHVRMNFSLRARLSHFETYPKLWMYERATIRRSALQVVCGKDDETFLRRFVSRNGNIEVVLNGVDPNYFYPTASAEPQASHPTILFCGAMDYNPNVDALRWYFGEMHDPLKRLIPNLELMIVGRDPVDEVKHYGRLPGVTVTGKVPDVRPFYRQAWLAIAPLRIGGGSRLKVVESLAMGTPVVSTRIGAQGLGLAHNKDILLADKPGDFVKETVRAVQSEPLRKHLKQGGLETVSSRLSWATLGKRLSELYIRYIGQKEAAAVLSSHS